MQGPPLPQHSLLYPNVPLKRTRSTRACDTCRRKRTKCSGGQPCEGCIAFGLVCAYTAPQKKRGPPKRAEAQKTQTTLGERLKTVESLLSGLIHGAPSLPAAKRDRSLSEASDGSGHRTSFSQYSDSEDDAEDEEVGVESDSPNSGFNGIALAIHRPKGREVGVARVSSPDSDPGASAPTFCQVPWRAGVTVTDPKSGVLVQSLSLNDESVIAHRFNNTTGNITIVEDVVTDTVLFYGSTSTSNTNALRQSPRFNDGVMSIALRSDVVPANAPISLDSPPCSPDLVHHLVSLYFTHVHPYFPMIDRIAFTRQLKEKQTEHFSLLLNSMCALVTQQTRCLAAWGISSPSELHRAFFERARALLGKQFDWPHINNVQALLLLTLVGAGTNTNAASYQYIGIAHRHAVELGMHRNLEKLNHPGLDNGMKEQMRATWFCMYILDRYTGVHQGRPFAINDDDWDTPLPCQDETSDVARMVRHVSLCSILGQIANYVNRPSGRRRRSRSSREQLVRDVDGELAQWHSLLPDDLRRDPTRDVGSWSFHHHLHVMYHTAVILLHRIATGRFGGVCVASAIAIRQTLEALPMSASSGASVQDDFVFVMPIVVYSGLTASTLFLDMVLDGRAHSVRPTPRRKRSKGEDDVDGEIALESGINALEELKKSLPVFEKLKDTSMFAVYYGQLIAECVRGSGVKVGETDRRAGNADQGEAAASSNRVHEVNGANGINEHVGDTGGPCAASLYSGSTPYASPAMGTPGSVQVAAVPDTLGVNSDTGYPGPGGMNPGVTNMMGGSNQPMGPSSSGPYFVDSIFSELLNPFFDPSPGWWGDMGLSSPPNASGNYARDGQNAPVVSVADGRGLSGSPADYFATPTSSSPQLYDGILTTDSEVDGGEAAF
ncbi:hypothetical protein SpCBS45565_g01252 [Spizellomyces sp. 'palustris']|nr:hypothetical protein SpCBS45565_g01252 [Spizellomyces sp. 'palustris']